MNIIDYHIILEEFIKSTEAKDQTKKIFFLETKR